MPEDTDPELINVAGSDKKGPLKLKKKRKELITET